MLPFLSRPGLRAIARLSLLATFVAVSSYLVLRFEYVEGNFLYYFFKANIWYAAHNKIIFPAFFWGVFLLFLALDGLIFRDGPPNGKAFLTSLRRAFVYHVYLLLLSHSEEIVPGFTLLPIHISSVPQITSYEWIFTQAFFIFYYALSIHTLFKAFAGGGDFRDLIFPVSAATPYFYSTLPVAHLSYWAFALAAYCLRQKVLRSGPDFLRADTLRSPRTAVLAVFLTGLFFRLWYACYFSTAETDMTGFSADGPAYYRSALAFANGQYGQANYWHAPFYSLYLSLFLTFLGHSPQSVFYGQAIVGSFAPVIVFKILQRLGLPRAAFISGLLVAVSHLCIHETVVINRSSPILTALPLAVYCCLVLNQFRRAVGFAGFGALLAMTFYFGQETAPTLAALVFYAVFSLAAQKMRWSDIGKKAGWALLGGAIVAIPLNLIYFNVSGKWIPLGRDASAYDSTSAWNYNGNPYAAEMIAKGFNPIKDPRGSLEVLASSPLDIGRLLFGKLFTEIPGFLFDPGGTFLTPLHLSFESFHAAHVQFYIYFFILAGLLLFLTNKQISPPIKGLVLAPVVLQALFASLAILGTFRFRAQITPLNMIFLGLAFEKLLFGRDDRRSRELEETERDESRLEFNRPCPAGWKGAAVIPVAAFLFLAGLLTLRGSQIDARDVGGSMPWLSIHEGNLIAIGNIGLDATLFAFYDSGKIAPAGKSEISFYMCSFLIPGQKPYYRLAVDGKFTGTPKMARNGCWEEKEEFRPAFKRGIVNLYMYYSPDGNAGEPVPVRFSHRDLKGREASIVVPMIPNQAKDPEMARLDNLFNYSSNGGVKVSQPVLLPGN